IVVATVEFFAPDLTRQKTSRLLADSRAPRSMTVSSSRLGVTRYVTRSVRATVCERETPTANARTPHTPTAATAAINRNRRRGAFALGTFVGPATGDVPDNFRGSAVGAGGLAVCDVIYPHSASFCGTVAREGAEGLPRGQVVGP